MIEDLCVDIEAISFVRSAQVDENKLHVVVTGDDEYSLRLEFPANFPLSLPNVFLVDHPDYGFFPHVAWSGQLCYSDSQAPFIDTDDPVGIIRYVLTESIKVLDEHEADGDAFWDEFEGFWAHQPERGLCIAMVELTDAFKTLTVRTNTDCASLIFYDEDTNEQTLGILKKSKFWGSVETTGYYCPLATNVGFPEPGEVLTMDHIEAAIRHMRAEDIEAFDIARSSGSNRQQRARNKNGFHVIFSQPRPAGSRSMVAVAIRWGHQVLNGNVELLVDHPPIAVDVKRLTRSHGVPRGGGALALGDQKIGVLGVGAVGSRVSELLAQSGATNLTLIDHDRFTADNVYRHILPAREVHRYKVDAMRDFLDERYPGMNVTPIRVPVLSASELARLNLDVLMVAIGDPTLEQAIAGDLPAPIVVTTWLDALGLGGHAILDDATPGCLQCLYHRDNTRVIPNTVSMIKPGERVSRNLTGCTGTFVPFGAADAMETAAVAVRLLIDRLTSNDPVQKYRYWKGTDNLAQRERIQTSDWYDRAGTDSANAELDERFDRGCPVCRDRGSTT